MQPFSRTNAASPATTHPLAAEANAADRELLIDIDFFDTQGRWNPRHVVFCTAIFLIRRADGIHGMSFFAPRKMVRVQKACGRVVSED